MATTPPVRTTCPYCGVGCGVVVEPGGDGGVTVRGDPDHPANHGRLCSKGAALAETLEMDGRLLHPEVRGRQVDWATAVAAVADGLERVIAEHGPGAVAMYVSGQMLTEDYYVANKLMKGFIGTANIDTNSRLCMASAVAGHRRAFGADVVPACYEDLERAKLVVLVGANSAWCHPVLYQRLAAARQENPDLQVVVIDPRRTATCDLADLHLPLRPGSDALLFNGLLAHLAAQGEGNPAFLASVDGADAALVAARESAPSAAAVAAGCDLDEAAVTAFYRLFARTERVVTAFSQGINQSSSGTDKVNAILNAHLYTGRIGRPGAGPLSLTGQPNAMGGREVGALANQLAAHMDLEDPAARERVGRLWGTERIPDTPGLKAVELFEAIEAGRVKAVWVLATNPLVSLPDSDRMRRALERCELVVVSDCVADGDTVTRADVRLPALAWGEKSGTVTNSERRISRQRAFLPAPGNARPDWWAVTRVARRLGHGAAFPYESPAAIFREHAALSGLDNDGRRPFDISGLAGLSDAGYDELAPVQWPLPASLPPAAFAHPGASPLPASLPPAAFARPGTSPLPASLPPAAFARPGASPLPASLPPVAGGTARLFGDGRFAIADGRARMVPVTPRAPAVCPDATRPLVLNTGRLRDQWHTMSRTGRVARLMRHRAEPTVAVHPADAEAAGVAEGDLARLAADDGEVVVRVEYDPALRRGEVFVPMHWNDAFTGRGRVNALVPAVTDPVSGQPESKHATVALQPYPTAWQGVLFSRRPLAPDSDYWARAPGDGLWRHYLAGAAAPALWGQAARGLLCAPARDVGWVEYHDTAAGTYRAARIVDDRLESCLFVGPERPEPDEAWLESLFAAEPLSPEDRNALLAGRAPAGTSERGSMVCACHGVGSAQVEAAIRDHAVGTVAGLGGLLKAGTGCGSCIPELKALLARNRPVPT